MSKNQKYILKTDPKKSPSNRYPIYTINLTLITKCFHWFLGYSSWSSFWKKWTNTYSYIYIFTFLFLFKIYGTLYTLLFLFNSTAFKIIPYQWNTWLSLFFMSICIFQFFRYFIWQVFSAWTFRLVQYFAVTNNAAINNLMYIYFYCLRCSFRLNS